MSEKIRRHYVVKGRVQGVGFRYKAYYVMDKPSYVLNRDPLLNDENNDEDK